LVRSIACTWIAYSVLASIERVNYLGNSAYRA